ncbi:MAG: TadA family conjugal transfer-associated ATPase [Propionibacteriaceae bacterium]|jgi:pilus assembly protein CpaF|nr:TadA family conjugal transfer-associated ATPase [Propionibacteriaceae bacterium]
MVELAKVREYLASHGLSIGPASVAQALRQLGYLVSEVAVRSTVDALLRDSVGAGPLEPLLALPGITDIVVNGPTQVFVDQGEGLRQVESCFGADAEVRKLAVRMAAAVGRRLDDGCPYVDARLPSGVRVHAILDCLTGSGTCLSLRIPHRVQLSLGDWVDSGTMSPVAATILKEVVARRLAFLVSGGTGSGKTTLLSTLLGLVPPAERLVIAEDSRELNPPHPHVVRLESRAGNIEGVGQVTLTALVRQALRMRPDRVVVGEVRGAEVVDLLMALNTGHEGGCGTIHANSAQDVPARLEALGALGGLNRAALHSQLAAALDLVVHIRRYPDGRRWVEEIQLLHADPADGLVSAVPAVGFSRSGAVWRGEGYGMLERMVG